MVNFPRRDEIWLVALDQSRGSEMRKTRPCLVVSPDDLNEPLRTVLVAPMTTRVRNYPSRVNLTFRNKTGQVALDQLRAVDRERFGDKLGTLPGKTAREVSSVLVEMFQR
jgi:mRNA interferase MazF